MADIKKIKLSGVTYDIKDATAIHEETKLSTEATGSGNAVTGIAVSDHKITVTKGETFATKAQLDSEASERARVDSALSDRVSSLEQRGRYLSGWNCSTGIPTTYPTIAVGETYTYKSGDYYIVTVGGTAGDKMPKGTGITRTSSGYTVPTDSIPTGETVAAGDTYTYDGTNFVLSHSANNNQTVTSGAVSFGPNDAVDFVGSGIVSVSGNASTKKITISASHQSLDHKQDKLAATGSANKPVYVSAAGVVSACNFTVDKSVPSNAVFTDHITTVASSGTGNAVTSLSADASGKVTYTLGETFAKASELHSHSNKAILDGISAANLLDASGSASKSKLQGIEAGAQVNVIENVAIGSIQGSVSSKVANFEAQVAGALALLDTVDASHITATIASNGSHTHSLSGTISGSGTVSIPTVSKTANKLVTTSISKSTASKATAGSNKTFITTAIKSASLTGTTTFNTDAIKSATCNQSFATGTFTGGVENIAFEASYNSADECLDLFPLTASTSAVSITTSAATTASVGIDTVDCGASEKDSITPYTFSEVNVATIASAITVATGGLSATGSGSDVTSTISIGTSEQSISVSASLSGTTGSAGEHNHTLA